LGILVDTFGSTLEDGCGQYAGRTLVVEPDRAHGWVHQVLVVEPYCGYGWHLATNPFAVAGGLPPPFRLFVARVYTYKGERRGVLARVAEPGFLYDGYWLVSMTRDVGVWNFTDRPAAYNLLLCPEEPVEGKPEDAPLCGKLWPIWHLRGRPHTLGCGRIAESLQRFAGYDLRQQTQARERSGPADPAAAPERAGGYHRG
jgi:hypothetical protein